MGASLITLAEYKAYEGINNTNQDGELVALIPMASQIAKTYCRRSFIDYVDDAKIDIISGGTARLYVTEFPILAVSSVELSTDYGLNYSALVEFTDYAIDKETESLAPINSTGTFPQYVNGYKITYTAGYEEVPQDLKVAVMDLVTYYQKNDMAVKSQRTAGSNTVQIEYITNNSLPAHISRILDAYVANVS